MLGIEFGEKLLGKKKGSFQDGQDQLKMGVRDLRWSASPEWRVLGGHEGAGVNKARSVRRTQGKTGGRKTARIK